MKGKLLSGGLVDSASAAQRLRALVDSRRQLAAGRTYSRTLGVRFAAPNFGRSFMSHAERSSPLTACQRRFTRSAEAEFAHERPAITRSVRGAARLISVILRLSPASNKSVAERL